MADKNLSLLLILLLSVFINHVLAEGTITVSDTWINEAPPTVSVLAAYGTIKNHSSKPISLLSVGSPDFKRIEIHRSVIKNEMVSMEKQDTLTIPSGDSVTLSPGDYHLMLFEPERPLRTGDTTELKLLFDNDEIISVKTSVERRKANDHNHHHHH